jgi:hypothetical protein
MSPLGHGQGVRAIRRSQFWVFLGGWLVLAVVGAAALLAGVGVVPAGAVVRDNALLVENGLAGTRGWRWPQAPGQTIEGYASAVSVLPGSRLGLHVSTLPAARYRVEVFRLGWYGGAGGRLLACVPSCTGDEAGAALPRPAFDPGTGYLDAGWPVTDTLTVGSDWVSGYYLADLVLTTGPYAGTAGWVPFIVREPVGRDSAILVQAAVNTWQAYNRWGGMSLYMNPNGASCKGICTHVSFDRPYDPKSQNFWSYELPLVRFLEEHGYDVSYTTDVDTDRDPAELLRHRLVIVAGHDEYWTATMRNAFQHARALGTNLAFTGANSGYWQMRYQDNRRTIVEYRLARLDPEPNPALKTLRFRSLTPPRPECELEGVQYTQGRGGPESIGGPFAYPVNPSALTDPWFTGTGFTATSTLPGLVGYEWDQVTTSCATPPLTILFHYPGPPAADAIRFTTPSGALVFSAGSLNFAHALDDYQPNPGQQPSGDTRLERFMQNALTDLTRPAAPTSITTARHGNTIVISTTRHPDPRIQTILVYRNRTLLCAHLKPTCTDHRPPHHQPLSYTAVLQDRWGTSTAIKSISLPVGAQDTFATGTLRLDRSGNK